MSSIEQTIEGEPIGRLPAATTDGPNSKVPIVVGRRGLLAISWIAPVLLLVVWEWLAQIGWLTPQVLPAPSKVLRTAFKLAVSGSLLNDLASACCARAPAS